MGKREPLTRYQWRLLFLLSVATFFEGYDLIALSQVLPHLRADLGLDESEGGLLVGLITIGSIGSFFLARMADVWGRRRLLTVTIAGYTIFTFLSGIAPGAYLFGACQLLARVFLIAEYTAAILYAVEAYPPSRHGQVNGIFAVASAMGSITCAALVPLLVKSPLGWRTVYLVGIAPLILIAVARRGLRETDAFAARGPSPRMNSMFHLWRRPEWRRLALFCAVWTLAGFFFAPGVIYFKEYALGDGGLEEKMVAGLIALSTLASLPLALLGSRLIDRAGAWTTSLAFLICSVVAVLTVYSSGQPAVLLPFLAVMVTSQILSNAALGVLTSNSFSVEVRGDALSWAHNLLGRSGNTVGLIVVAAMGESMGWTTAMLLAAAGPAVAVLLTLFFLRPARPQSDAPPVA